MQYTESQLTKLIEDVEREFTSHLAKAEETSEEVLAKAEDGEKKPEKKPEEKSKEDKAPPKAEAKPEGDAQPEDGAPPAQAAPAQAAPAQPAAQPAGHGYDDEDMNHLRQMYQSMSADELKLHHDIIKECMDALNGQQPIQKNEEVGQTGEPHGSPGAKAPATKTQPDFNKSDDGLIKPCQPSGSPGPETEASKAHGEKLNKGEAKTTRQSGGKIEATGEPHGSPGAKAPATKEQGNLSNMEKSEQVNGTEELLKSELADFKAKYDELKKNYDGVADFLTKLVQTRTAPPAKAITNLDAVQKSESTEEKSFTKSEVHSILCKKSAEPTLQKSDREAINKYYDEGQVDIKGISHLLK